MNNGMKVCVIISVIVMTACIVSFLTGILFTMKTTWEQVVGVIVLTPIVAFILYAGARRANLFKDE